MISNRVFTEDTLALRNYILEEGVKLFDLISHLIKLVKSQWRKLTLKEQASLVSEATTLLKDCEHHVTDANEPGLREFATEHLVQFLNLTITSKATQAEHIPNVG